MDRDGVAMRIKKLRGNMSQREFGAQFDVTQGQIAHLENARVAPSVEFILRLSQKYNRSIDFILKGEKPNNKPVHDPEIVALRHYVKTVKTLHIELEKRIGIKIEEIRC